MLHALLHMAEENKMKKACCTHYVLTQRRVHLNLRIQVQELSLCGRIEDEGISGESENGGILLPPSQIVLSEVKFGIDALVVEVLVWKDGLRNRSVNEGARPEGRWDGGARTFCDHGCTNLLSA